MSESQVLRRVVKLGGSLLALPDCVERFRAWRAAQVPAETLLIVGGGALADEVREADHRESLSESTAHWLSVRAMLTQSQWLAALLPEAELAASVVELCAKPPHARLVIVNPWRFVHDEDPQISETPLPENWDVTSDSIAARLAQLTMANELVLLKSATASTTDLQVLAADGYVDRYFPHAALAVPRVRLVNLRETDS